ncbi:MAG: N-6 DNA methylase [Flavobacteriaceae bacterium]|nr:N-6 DNA methylase [Flavobacteriaceae bacterium]
MDVRDEVKREKILTQFLIIKDRSLLNQIDHQLGKTPLRHYAEVIRHRILEKITINLRDDVLGQFYGEFMRYSGADQKLGVVLTPNHITELFCDLIELEPTDKVIDPCCGTGSFLVKAMYFMAKKTSESIVKERIKTELIHGIEVREDMFSIASTNMILRGDGKSNLIFQNFLAIPEKELRKERFTVGFINPPYSQSSRETPHLSEISFIEKLLNVMSDKGRVVAIIPLSAMTGKNDYDRNIKRRILEEHTLEGVITLNHDTFYHIGTNTCIAVFKAFVPHPPNKYCKFIDFKEDGYIVRKHFGLDKTESVEQKKEKLLNCWLNDAPSENEFMIKSKVRDEDEWVHSFYYYNDTIPSYFDFEKTITDYLSFEFKMVMEGRGYLFKEMVYQQKVNKQLKNLSGEVIDLQKKQWSVFELKDIFTINASDHGTDKNKLDLRDGVVPYITRTNMNNGHDCWVVFQSGIQNTNSGNSITIGLDTQTVFYQEHDFYTGQNIQVLRNQRLNREVAMFLIPLIKTQLEKFNWGGNGATLARLKRTKMKLPINAHGHPDFNYMEHCSHKIFYEKLKQYLNY